MRRAGALVGALLLVAGCGTQSAGAPRAAGTADEIPAVCPDEFAPMGDDYAAGVRLPADVDPVAVLRCVVDFEDDPATGRWRVVRTEKATTGIEAYAAALRLEDVPRPPGDYACTADALILPWSAVVLPDGKALKVGLPVDECGKPRGEVMKALDALTFDVVSTERVEKVASTDQLTLEQQAADAGCAYQWKDEIGMIGEFSGDVPRQILPASGRLTACRYLVAGPGQDGTWVGGGVVPGKDADAVRQALVSSAVAPPCSAPRTGFVIVTGADGDFVTVDLSCPRLMVGDALGALPQGSIDLLVSLTPDA